MTVDAKTYSVGDYVLVFQEVVPPKRTTKLLKKWRGPFQTIEVHQGGRFYRFSTGRAPHYENIKPHHQKTGVFQLTCMLNERGTRDKNDGKEVVDNCDLPLDLELTE